MSEDLKIIIDVFNDLDDDEQIDFYLHFEDVFKGLFKLDLQEERRIRDRENYKKNEKTRKAQSERAKRYYQKKKREKEKNKSNIKNAEDEAR